MPSNSTIQSGCFGLKSGEHERGRCRRIGHTFENRNILVLASPNVHAQRGTLYNNNPKPSIAWSHVSLVQLRFSAIRSFWRTKASFWRILCFQGTASRQPEREKSTATTSSSFPVTSGKRKHFVGVTYKLEELFTKCYINLLQATLSQSLDAGFSPRKSRSKLLSSMTQIPGQANFCLFPYAFLPRVQHIPKNWRICVHLFTCSTLLIAIRSYLLTNSSMVLWVNLHTLTNK